MTSSFHEKLRRASESNQSLLCVGLDPDPVLMPVGVDLFEFNRRIIDATKNLVCAYKPNLAFYDALGEEGYSALRQTVEYIRSTCEIPIIGDSKRGDVQSTSKFHARAMFEVWEFDASTINPYAGHDAAQPFLEYSTRGIFVWCRSSNPGASEFQDLEVSQPNKTGEREVEPLYMRVARQATRWNYNGNVGLVVGATYPDELKRIRSAAGAMLVLIPGVGAQQGSVESAVESGVDENGRNAVINVSRSILYANDNPTYFDEKAGCNTSKVRKMINDHLTSIGKGWSESTTCRS